MLGLPEDVLATLVESWLNWEEVVSLDSATCEHSHRPRLVQVLSKCSLNSNDVVLTKGMDRYVRWRALRENSALLKLTVSGTMSKSFAQDCAYSTALANLQQLVVTGPVKKDSISWLEKVVPFCHNLQSIQGLGIGKDGADWLPALGKKTMQQLKVVDFEFNDERQNHPRLLHHFQDCESLETLRWKNRTCKGIDLVVPKNKNLSYVVISHCKFMTEETFAQLFSLPLLEKLHLSCGGMRNGCTLRGTDDKLNITSTALTTIALHSFYSLTEADVRRIVAAIPRKEDVKFTLHYPYSLGLISQNFILQNQKQKLGLKELGMQVGMYNRWVGVVKQNVYEGSEEERGAEEEEEEA